MNTLKHIKKDLKIKVIALIALWVFLLIRTPSFEELLASFIMFGVLLVIPYRLIKLFSFVDDIVLDPFAGSGTTLKVARELKRNYIGYELYEHYKQIIECKIQQEPSLFENLR